MDLHRVAPFIVDWALPHQSIIKAISPDMAKRQSDLSDPLLEVPHSQVLPS